MCYLQCRDTQLYRRRLTEGRRKYARSSTTAMGIGNIKRSLNYVVGLLVKRFEKCNGSRYGIIIVYKDTSVLYF